MPVWVQRMIAWVGGGFAALVLLGGVPVAVLSSRDDADAAVRHHAAVACLRQAAAEGRAVRRTEDPTIVDGPRAGCPEARWIRWSEMEATPPPAPDWRRAFLDRLRVLLSGVALVAAAVFAVPWTVGRLLALYLGARE